MSNIHGAAGKPKPTTRDLANSHRIGRARFFGNAIGGLLLIAILAGLYVALGNAIGFKPPLYTVLTPKPDSTLVLPGPIATLILAILYLLIFIDLAIRRRHDRNRSGVDVMVWAEVVVGGLVLHLFGPATLEGMVVDGVSGLLTIYLLFVLIFLGGTKGPNSYGEDPRDMQRRADH